ncbi:MAG: hypothetical protein EP343_34685 [Deltaproteobacteria bacterium]|nr:MAG: hypothetical protein EP343_34685 [Deltaproteobacteria bacterium]
MSRSRYFSSVRTEGGLLPSEILGRIQALDKNLEGTSSESYHLGPHERIGEAANRAWSRLTASWHAFQEALTHKPENDPATGLTRERWLLPLFQELGYGRLPRTNVTNIDGKDFAISHFWQSSPIHLLGCRLDLGQKQSGVSGAAKSSPHGLVQEFLNRSNEHLWGFVSNGYQLRILRDHRSLTRQAYVEFDLQAIMEGDQYSEFLLLWMVCHQSRVETQGEEGGPESCWLETWFKTSREEGVRALDKLRSGVESAIASLGTGFLKHKANTALRDALETGELVKQEYYRQLLRLVYRIIFLFVAEERGALLDPAPYKDCKQSEAAKKRFNRYYSTRRMRELANKRRGGPHSDTWQGLCLVMDKLYDGYPALALPALGSRLWSPAACPWLLISECSNEWLFEAFRSLCIIQDKNIRYPVNWRNVGAEELGSIYESLLELHPRINKEGGSFELETAAGHERKTTGSYYTPSSLVDCLLDSALDPVLDEASKKENPEQAILELTVCDPACGSGHFLLAAARRIAKRLASVRSGDEEPSPRETQRALRDVIGRCIYGVDLNPMAVELCKVSLWIEALEPGRPLSFLDSHIQSGNALLGTTPALMAKGIPDDAFKPIEGDDKKVAKELKARNKKERTGEMYLFDLMAAEPSQDYNAVATRAEKVEKVSDSDIVTVRQKESEWEELTRSPQFRDEWFRADAWCSAFVWPKLPGELERAAITHNIWLSIQQDVTAVATIAKRKIRELAKLYRFFHWHLAFPQVFNPKNNKCTLNGGEGFNVILGNPPWIRQEEFRPLKPLLATYSSFASTADLSVYFIELSVRILQYSGRVGLLTPNKWFRAKYGSGLREFIQMNALVSLIVDFGHAKNLFEGADTFPAAVVLELSSQDTSNKTFQFVRAFDKDRKIHSLDTLVKNQSIEVPFTNLTNKSWRFDSVAVSQVIRAISDRGVKLRDYIKATPKYGLKTGFNEAFYLSANLEDSLLQEFPNYRSVIKKFIRGRDIRRWQIGWEEQWHIVIASSANIEWPWSESMDEKQAEDTFAETFPFVYEHLKKFEKKLRARTDQGKFWWELRSCEYYESFSSPKIAISRISYHCEVALDTNGYFQNDSTVFLPTDDLFVLAILNSPLAWWYMTLTFPHKKDEALSMDIEYLENFPIPNPPNELRAQIVETCQQLMDTELDIETRIEFEKQLSTKVYKAYGFSELEIQIVTENPVLRDPIQRITQES